MKFTSFAALSVLSTNPVSIVQEPVKCPADPNDIDAVSHMLAAGSSRPRILKALKEISGAAFGRARRHDAFLRTAGVPFPGDPNEEDCIAGLILAVPFAQEPAKNPDPPVRPAAPDFGNLDEYERALEQWCIVAPNQVGAKNVVTAAMAWIGQQQRKLEEEARVARVLSLSNPDDRVLSYEDLEIIKGDVKLLLKWADYRVDVDPGYGFASWHLLSEAGFLRHGPSQAGSYFGDVPLWSKEFMRRFPEGTVRSGFGNVGKSVVRVSCPDGKYSTQPSNAGWIHGSCELFGKSLPAGYSPAGTLAALEAEYIQKQENARKLEERSRQQAHYAKENAKGLPCYLVFHVHHSTVKLGVQPEMCSIAGGSVQIPAVRIGNKSRGSSSDLIPVSGLEEKVVHDRREVPAFQTASLGKTQAGKIKLIAHQGAVDDSHALVILHTDPGFRGSGWHAGERRSDGKCGAFPGQVLADGSLSASARGALGVGSEVLALVPKGAVFSAHRVGKLYGAPSTHYYVFDGVEIRTATLEERQVADLWQDLGLGLPSAE